MPAEREQGHYAGYENSSIWGWIAGAVVVVLLAFAVVGFLGRDGKFFETNQEVRLKYQAEQKAFMQECIPQQTESRCLELFRWRK